LSHRKSGSERSSSAAEDHGVFPAGGSLCFQLTAGPSCCQTQTLLRQVVIIVSDSNIVCRTRFIVFLNNPFCGGDQRLAGLGVINSIEIGKRESPERDGYRPAWLNKGQSAYQVCQSL
jgi:hypothetical protein